MNNDRLVTRTYPRLKKDTLFFKTWICQVVCTHNNNKYDDEWFRSYITLHAINLTWGFSPIISSLGRVNPTKDRKPMHAKRAICHESSEYQADNMHALLRIGDCS